MGFFVSISKLIIKLIFPKRNNSWLFRIWEFSLKSTKKFFYLSIILMIIEVIFDTIEPYSLSQLVNLISDKNKTLKEISNIIFNAIFIFFGNRFFEILKDRCANLFNKEVTKNLQKEYYISLLKKDFEFFDKNKNSIIYSILTNDLNIIGDISILGFINLMKQLCQSFVCIIILFYISKKMCFAICIFVPIISLFNSLKKNYLIKKDKEKEESEKKSNNFVLEILNNIKVIKSFSTELKEKIRYGNILNSIFTNESKIINLSIIFEGIMIFFFNIIILLSIEYEIYLIQGNDININSLISFSLYCKIIYNSFSNVVKFSRNFDQAFILSQNFFSIIDYKPKVETYSNDNENSEIGLKREIEGNIALKNIHFNYIIDDKNKMIKVLKSINLNINKGSFIGIVGLSGSGKSTLINLILRLYDIEINTNDKNNKIMKEQNKDDEIEKLLQNENKNDLIYEKVQTGIFFDDINIKDYNIKNFHEQIGYVQQEPSLFNDTIYKNIVYGLDDSQILNNKIKLENEIKKYIHMVQADFVFDPLLFPLGLETVVGDKGSKLSGGQKQKIAIVRALIKEPKILILDEATSAFDSESEFKFKLEMKKLKGKMTTIMISHRLSLIKDCDQIIVIDKGKIEEQGNHEQLIRLKGIYYNLMENQINE